MHTQDEPERPSREIRDVALLDLTGAQAESALEGVSRISRVAAILVPERLLAKLSSIPMDGVAATIPMPDDRRAKVFSGQITLSGETLVGGDSRDIMVVSGQLILTSPIPGGATTTASSDLIVLGQLIAPAGSEAALGAVLRRVSGQVLYYPYVEGAGIRVLTTGAVSGEALANGSGGPTDVLLATGQLVVTSPIQRLGYQQIVAIGHLVVPKETDPALLGRLTTVSGQLVTYTAPPRIFDGRDHFSAAFFEFLDEPITLVLDGRFSFDADVTPELLRQKVAGIVLDGRLTAPRRLVPALQVLCIARDGRIAADDELE